jgi:Immunity protein 52
MVEAWDPVRCAAYPDALRGPVPRGKYFRESWILYLCPWLAALVIPPASAIVERLPNGGPLMSAATQPFDVENAAHMAVARAMAAANAPLNTLPWEDRARA